MNCTVKNSPPSQNSENGFQLEKSHFFLSQLCTESSGKTPLICKWRASAFHSAILGCIIISSSENVWKVPCAVIATRCRKKLPLKVKVSSDPEKLRFRYFFSSGGYTICSRVSSVVYWVLWQSLLPRKRKKTRKIRNSGSGLPVLGSSYSMPLFFFHGPLKKNRTTSSSPFFRKYSCQKNCYSSSMSKKIRKLLCKK